MASAYVHQLCSSYDNANGRGICPEHIKTFPDAEVRSQQKKGNKRLLKKNILFSIVGRRCWTMDICH